MLLLKIWCPAWEHFPCVSTSHIQEMCVTNSTTILYSEVFILFAWEQNSSMRSAIYIVSQTKYGKSLKIKPVCVGRISPHFAIIILCEPCIFLMQCLNMNMFRGKNTHFPIQLLNGAVNLWCSCSCLHSQEKLRGWEDLYIYSYAHHFCTKTG